MSFPVTRFLPALLAVAMLVLPVRSQRPYANPAEPAPYVVYQGIGDLLEERAARVCFVYGVAENCWNAGGGITEVNAEPITLPSGHRLILVNSLLMEGSGGTVFLSLLDEQNQLPVNLLPRVELTSASKGTWGSWQIEGFSSMPVIATADPVLDEDEGRATAHRYAIRAYTFEEKTARYVQRFAYTSSRKYEGSDDVLAMERQAATAMLPDAMAMAMLPGTREN